MLGQGGLADASMVPLKGTIEGGTMGSFSRYSSYVALEVTAMIRASGVIRGLAFAYAVATGALGSVAWAAETTPAQSGVKPETATAAGSGSETGKRIPGREFIRQAQRALKDKGHDPGPIDGVLGRRTRAALRHYQQAEGLNVTGQLDTETGARLGLPRGVGPPSRERVLELQKALAETGHDPGPMDGIFGPKTKAALRSYVAVPPPSVPNATRETIERFRRESDRPQSP